jgi:hypothetical protein
MASSMADRVEFSVNRVELGGAAPWVYFRGRHYVKPPVDRVGEIGYPHNAPKPSVRRPQEVQKSPREGRSEWPLIGAAVRPQCFRIFDRV